MAAEEAGVSEEELIRAIGGSADAYSAAKTKIDDYTAARQSLVDQAGRLGLGEQEAQLASQVATLNELSGTLDDARGAYSSVTSQQQVADRVTAALGKTTQQQTQDFKEAAKAAEEQESALRKLVDTQLDAAGVGDQLLRAQLDVQRNVEDLADAYTSLDQAQAEQTKNPSAENALKVRDATRALQDQVLGTRGSILDYAQAAVDAAQKQAEANGATLSAAEAAKVQRDALEELKAKFPGLASVIQEYIDKLNAIPRNVQTSVSIINKGGAGYSPIYDANGNRIKASAVGGPIGARELQLVGENGPEFFAPGVAGTIIPNTGIAPGSMPVGSGIVINVTAGLGSDGARVGQQIVEALRAYERRAGSSWRAA